MIANFATRLAATACLLAAHACAHASNVYDPNQGVVWNLKSTIPQKGQYALGVVYLSGPSPEDRRQAAAVLGAFHRDSNGRYVQATGVPATFKVQIRRLPQGEVIFDANVANPQSRSRADGRVVDLATVNLSPGTYEASVTRAGASPALASRLTPTELVFGKAHHGK